MWLINYSEALEEEGTFGEVAKNAWKKAAEAWTAFSNRDMPTQYNFSVRLGDKELYDERCEAAKAELAKLTPEGLRDKIAAEKIAALSEKERDNFNSPAERRTPEQREAFPMIADRVAVNYLEIADRITGENRAAAVRWADEAAQAEFVARAIDTDRDIVNYDYWVLRCQIEPTDETLSARKLFYDADQAFLAADLVKSSELYEEGLTKWRQVLDAHPKLLDDPTLSDELTDSIKHYRSVMHQLDRKFPSSFILQDVVEANSRFRGTKLPTSENVPSADADQPAPKQPKPGPGGEPPAPQPAAESNPPTTP